MTNVIPIAKPEVASRQIGGWVETEASKIILRSLELIRAMDPPALTMVAGAPGLGITKSLFRFKNTHKNVLIHVAVQGEGGVWNLANELYRLLDIEDPNGRRLPEERRRIAEAVGFESMLLIDEAQYLVQRNGRGRDDLQPWPSAASETRSRAIAAFRSARSRSEGDASMNAACAASS
ncbi:ATP-binding protein [Rhodovulum visakhapatnamense]|uniref:AAA domain-containing protein n=1 Tax=Rhodovulum visakhapatnamense TaxID=364297 RepID=A0A4R8FTZ4_9RHOB|nr:ATP-binding protein [Rhodovulum visakhapatnamense]TDX30190.1 hypothetical protein EV657_107161 [Rhodovulum visakhapatnamense]